MCRKLIKQVTQEYEKGVEYNLADGELNLPKFYYTTYFENDDTDTIEG